MILAPKCKKSASLVGKVSRVLSGLSKKTSAMASPRRDAFGLDSLGFLDNSILESSTAETPALTAGMTSPFSDHTSRLFSSNPKRRKQRLGPTLTLMVILSQVCGLSAQTVQTYSRPDYRSHLQQAVSAGSSARIEQLLTSQRGEAMRFIEAFLDSAAAKKAHAQLDSAEIAWKTAKTVADHYAQIFGDAYYVDRARRYQTFDLQACQQKARLIALKKTSQDLFYRGEFEAALESYGKALTIAEDIGDLDDVASLSGSLGAVEFYLGNFETALDHYRKSLGQLERIGDRRRIGNRLGNIATAYSDMSDYPTALSYYEKAMAIRKELDDEGGLAADLNNTGLVYEELGEYRRALANYQEALALNRKLDNKRRIGNNLANIANVHINLGDYPEAIRIYEDALALRRAEGDARGEGNDYGNLGEVYKSLGDYKKAEQLFEQALAIHRDLGYREGEAYQLGRMAYLWRLKGHFAKAVVAYQDALAIHREIGHARGEATWLTALGQTYAAVGDYRQALNSLQQALQLHRDIGNRSGEAETLKDLGYIALKEEKVQDARKNFREALAIAEELEEAGTECLVLSDLAYTYSLNGDSLTAVTTWRKAFLRAEELGERGLQGWIQLQLGDFRRERDAVQAAHQAYEQGLAISEGLPDSELRWQLYYGRGQLWASAGENQRAFYSYQAAIDIIEEMRSKAVAAELKAGVIHDRFEAYEAMVSLLLSMGRIQEAFAFVERARSRSLLDMLGNARISPRDSVDQRLFAREQALRAKIAKLRSQISTRGERAQGIRGSSVYHADLDDALQEYQSLLVELKLRDPQYASLVAIESVSATQVSEWLDADSALLEYFMTDDQIIVFVLTKTDMHAVTVDESMESLRAKIVHFRGTAVHEMDEETLRENYWMAPLHKLYQKLIEPVQKSGYLAGKSRLIVVPQGLLAYLPFQALVSRIETREGTTGTPRFLVEDYTISYAPSASILKFLRRKDPQVRDSVLLLAPEIDVLPLSDEEVTHIAQTFGPGAEYHLAGEATETLVKEHGREYDLLHFATTAQFNKANPLFSSLSLAASNEDDGRLEVNEIFALDLKASLVTLSACETAIGSGYVAALPHGDDFISLTNAFLYAGTPAVVASLWEVADPSTSVFMQRFYKYLKQKNAAEALGMAQRDMITGSLGGPGNNGPSRYAHPYFWAPFILVGDGN